MKICIVSDAWHPQINGVVRTLESIRTALCAMGHRVEILGPDRFCCVACPTYPEIRLAIAPTRRLTGLLEQLDPDAIHIATEGPLGLAARRYCLERDAAFTTAYHTNFPDYFALRSGLPAQWFYAGMRRFHRPSSGVMVSTAGLRRRLETLGFERLRIVPRGVDTETFRPRPAPARRYPRPVHLCVGRIAPEKNLEAFLDLELPGTKLIIGDGPARGALEKRYPEAVFTGALTGEALAEAYAQGDVFVFPSRTDTFGLVLLEALASGVPVAGFPVAGPRDVIGADGRGTAPWMRARVGCLDMDLATAISRALDCRGADCRAYAEHYSWQACAQAFLRALACQAPSRYGAASKAVVG